MIAISFSKPIRERLQNELENAIKLNNFRFYRIVQSLIWISESHPISEIAKFFRISRQTVYDWLERFMSGRFGWLCRHRYQGRGRKSKLTDEQKKQLYDMVVAGPLDNGFDCGIWNTAMIAELIWLKFGVR